MKRIALILVAAALPGRPGPGPAGHSQRSLFQIPSQLSESGRENRHRAIFQQAFAGDSRRRRGNRPRHHPGLDDLHRLAKDRRGRPGRRLFLRSRGPGRQHLGESRGIRPRREPGIPRKPTASTTIKTAMSTTSCGWDFAFDDPDPDCYIFDGMRRDSIQPYWHSISALGIIGAKGNNGIGVAGINWDVSMMLLKIGAQGIGRDEKDTERPGRAAKAIRYAADNGARVINWSGFVSDPTPAALEELRAAIEYAGKKNVLLVVGAGNSGAGCRQAREFHFSRLLRLGQHPDRGHDRLPGRTRPLQSRGELARIELRGAERRYRRPGREFHHVPQERPKHLRARRRDIQLRPGRDRHRRADLVRQSRSFPRWN